MSRFPSFVAPILAVALAGLAGGCAHDGVATSDVMPAAYRAPMPEDALATLPARAGKVVGVSEKRFENGLEQRIVLAGDATTPGENTLDVAIGKRRPENYGADRVLKLKKPDQRVISQELGERFPGLAMRISGDFGQNVYGPFAYASGEGKSGTRCFYAWQWIDGRAGGDLFSFDQPRRFHDMSLRVRLCRKDLNAADFVEAMAALRLSGKVVSSPL